MTTVGVKGIFVVLGARACWHSGAVPVAESDSGEVWGAGSSAWEWRC